MTNIATESYNLSVHGSARKTSDRHVTALDGVRAVAIISVMLFHFGGWLPDRVPVLRFVKQCAGLGWTGVDLFFVLSGFLITGILLDTKKADNYFQAFYSRRILRIFPLYYAALTVLFLSAGYWATTATPLPAHKIWYFLYLSNWSDLSVPLSHLIVTGHFWTLAVEEQFYIIWPVCIYFLPRHLIWRACVAAIAFALVSRCLLLAFWGPSDLIYKALFTRMDTLLIGALGAIAVRKPTLLKAAKPFLGPSAFAVLITAFSVSVVLGQVRFSHVSRYMQSFGYSFVAVGFGLFVLWAYATNGHGGLPQRVLRLKPLTRIGKYSYGMYVYHIPLLCLASDAAVRLSVNLGRISRSLGFIALVSAATFLLAVASYEFYERWFLGFKPRYSVSPGESDTKANLVVSSARA